MDDNHRNGTLSEDGRWRWNGQQWQPVEASVTEASPYQVGDLVNGHVLGPDLQWHVLGDDAAPVREVFPLRFDAPSYAFQGSLAQVMELGAKAVAWQGWRVISADEHQARVTFATPATWDTAVGTGGTLWFTEAAPTWWRVKGDSSQNMWFNQNVLADRIADRDLRTVLETMVAIATT